ncbi:hypothetical protein VNI00_015239 [Paramarasmius palmivorus]|uniref:Protein kinase domain-containing protein n=1 Tax=Paramarasmius palmivorus TaxID=297713 RepID=A0AAW0BLP8_9AGAR
MKEYLREAIIWRQLRHPNVLPCLGLYYLDDTQQRICLVSPWMENGNLVEYMQARPRESINHVLLMHDITSGLSHLHALKVVHGDLKGFNVLITRSHRACLADFGLSHVADSQVFKVTSTVTHSAGTARWSAPEIHDGASSTTQSDIYSIGCLYYEIITGLLPFHNLRNELAVLSAIFRGLRPEKPQNIDIQDEVWLLMNECWESEPALRPTAENLLQRLPVVTPAEDWDNRLFNELQRNVAASDKAHPPLASIFNPGRKRHRSPPATTSTARKKQKHDLGKELESPIPKRLHISGWHTQNLSPGPLGAGRSERPLISSTYGYANTTNENQISVGTSNGTVQTPSSRELRDFWKAFMHTPAGPTSNPSYPHAQEEGEISPSPLPSGMTHTTTDTSGQSGDKQPVIRNVDDLRRYEAAVLARKVPPLYLVPMNPNKHKRPMTT